MPRKHCTRSCLTTCYQSQRHYHQAAHSRKTQSIELQVDRNQNTGSSEDYTCFRRRQAYHTYRGKEQETRKICAACKNVRRLVDHACIQSIRVSISCTLQAVSNPVIACRLVKVADQRSRVRVHCNIANIICGNSFFPVHNQSSLFKDIALMTDRSLETSYVSVSLQNTGIVLKPCSLTKVRIISLRVYSQLFRARTRLTSQDLSICLQQNISIPLNNILVINLVDTHVSRGNTLTVSLRLCNRQITVLPYEIPLNSYRSTCNRITALIRYLEINRSRQTLIQQIQVNILRIIVYRLVVKPVLPVKVIQVVSVFACITAVLNRPCNLVISPIRVQT